MSDLLLFKLFKHHHMKLPLCHGPVWEDILTGKWAHFQLGTGNEKKPRQTESKSKQIPMRPGAIGCTDSKRMVGFSFGIMVES